MNARLSRPSFAAKKACVFRDHDALAKWRFLAVRAQVMRHELHARLGGQRADHGEVGVRGHERAAETRRGLQVLQHAREERRVSAPFV